MQTISKELATALKRKRGEDLITRSQLAEQLHINVATLRKIETGEKTEVINRVFQAINNWLLESV